MFKLIKEVRDINRLREILTVLFEEGFDFLITKVRLKHRVPLTKRLKTRIESKKSFPIEKRLRLTLERLGPTFIKFGQLLSVRPDLIPKNYIKELEKLQDRVPQFPVSIVKEQIKKEFRKDINEIFSNFEENPIASASISRRFFPKSTSMVRRWLATSAQSSSSMVASRRALVCSVSPASASSYGFMVGTEPSRARPL